MPHANRYLLARRIPDQTSIEKQLVSGGNLVNLAAGDRNPIGIMDLGLALQSLSLRFLVDDKESLKNGVQPVPREVEQYVAQRAVEHWTE